MGQIGALSRKEALAKVEKWHHATRWVFCKGTGRPGNGAVSFGFSGAETHLVPVGLGSIGLRLKAVWIGMVLVKLRFGTVWFGLQQPSKATGPLSLPPPMPPAAVASIVALPPPSRRPLAHPAQRSPFAPAGQPQSLSLGLGWHRRGRWTWVAAGGDRRSQPLLGRE